MFKKPEERLNISSRFYRDIDHMEKTSIKLKMKTII